MHAHDFRDAQEFAGKSLLIVGASYSAEDIALQCHKYGARHVTMCWRTKPMGFHWPQGMDERPLLMKLDGKTAHFKDGSKQEVDAIILCTGYQHHFPFLEEKLRLKTRNRLNPPGLYKGVFWEKNPQPHVSRHAGPVLHVLHVRRAGVARPRLRARPGQAAVDARRWRRKPPRGWRARTG